MKRGLVVSLFTLHLTPLLPRRSLRLAPRKDGWEPVWRVLPQPKHYLAHGGLTCPQLVTLPGAPRWAGFGVCYNAFAELLASLGPRSWLCSFQPGDWDCAVGLEFDWDPHKAAVNLSKHRVSFSEAATVFRDSLSMTVPDLDHLDAEDRLITIGRSERRRLLIVSHSERRNRIRIISAREPTERERRDYEEIG